MAKCRVTLQSLTDSRANTAVKVTDYCMAVSLDTKADYRNVTVTMTLRLETDKLCCKHGHYIPVRLPTEYLATRMQTFLTQAM